jgi:hypothetical protein
VSHRAHDYPFLLKRWRAVARRTRNPLRPLCVSDDHDLVYWRSRALELTGGIYISAGIHGDEPGATEALITWAEKRAEELNTMPLLILPCLNPWGLVNNSRYDSRGRDLNRLFHRDSPPVIRAVKRLLEPLQFALALHLHEDFDAQGVYIYEVQRSRPFWGEGLLDSVRPLMPVEGRGIVDGRRARGGLIRRRLDMKRFNEIGYPEAIHLHQHHSQRTFTIETPSEFALEQRVRAQVAIIDECVRRIVNPSPGTSRLR